MRDSRANTCSKNTQAFPSRSSSAREFRYRHPVLNQKTHTARRSRNPARQLDTLEAIREGKRRGALTLGIVNTVGSTIARETDAGVYNHAGPEIGVASTKAFVSQLTALALLTIFLGRQRTMTHRDGTGDRARAACASRKDPEDPRRTRSDREARQEICKGPRFPLHRPQIQLPDRVRRRAQAQGNFLHPRRRLRRRGNEARPTRDDRREFPDDGDRAERFASTKRSLPTSRR